MNARLIQYTLLASVCPASGVVLILAYHNDPNVINLVLILATLLQLPMMLLCQRAMLPYIHPDIDVLTKLGVSYVPAPFEPGRYKIDSRVSAAARWLSMLGPLFIWLALRYPETVTVLNFYTYTAPSINLLALGFVSLLLGIVAFPFWVQMARASAMYAMGSDRKRYLMRGLFDYLDSFGGVMAYENARRGKFDADPQLQLRKGGASA